MIRMVQSSSGAAAKQYFGESLSQADYYLDDQEIKGRFDGMVADALGVKGDVTKRAFFNLVDNKHPKSHRPLTPRTKSNRRTGWDLSFHVPKSVSILHAFKVDDTILNGFRQSVRDTMTDIERDMQTRVRIGGQYSNRTTGNMIWAEFIHQTARPTKHHDPDMNLHAHCYIFNVTHDGKEARYKAADIAHIKKNLPYFQSLFHKRLAGHLMEQGYGIRKTKAAFEIDSIPQQAIDLFSKRTSQIKDVAKAKNIIDPKELSELGARTRGAKQKGKSMTALRQSWHKQLTASGLSLEIVKSKQATLTPAPEKEARKCIDHALNHCFERMSVVSEKKILGEAVNFALDDKNLTIGDIHKAFYSNQEIIRITEKNETLCTTWNVFLEEKHMVDRFKSGQNACKALTPFQPNTSKDLNPEQKAAIHYVLQSKDRVMAIEGRAGTGKTTLMKETVKSVRKSGKKVYAFAPTADASRGVLREAGFSDADTVAKLLHDKAIHNKVKGQCVWVDEAGLLGTKDMTGLLDLAETTNCRVILSGDIKQHTPAPRRGDAFRVLKTFGGMETVSLTTLYRQKARVYRDIVQDISDGHISKAFEELDKRGFIREATQSTIVQNLADDYCRTVQSGKKGLVICPTHKQGQEAARIIRGNLKDTGRIRGKDRTFTRFIDLNLTKAEKQNTRNFTPGMIIQYNLPDKGIKRGEQLTVTDVDKKNVQVRNRKNHQFNLPLKNADRFSVCRPESIQLAKGDVIRITRNGFDSHHNRLDNGLVLKIHGFHPAGHIYGQTDTPVKSGNKKTFLINKDYGNLNYAYVSTSHSAQSKTVDKVFIYQPAGTFPASDEKQFYVSVSRGRDGVMIYTDHKEELLTSIQRKGERLSASELDSINKNIERADVNRALDRQKENIIPAPQKDKTHEPEI